MAFFSQYATGKSLKQLLNFVGMKNSDEARCMTRTILGYLKNAPVGVFDIYSLNILADNKFQFPENFAHDLYASVDGNALNYNFNDPLKTAKKVNKVISNGTFNYIQNTVSPALAPKIFYDSAKLVSVTGIYFAAPLEKPWNRANVTLRIFYVSENKTVQIPFAYQSAIQKYKKSCKLDAQIVQLEFKNGSFQVVLVVPNKLTGIKKLISKVVMKPQIFVDELKSLKEELVELYVPVFNNESAVVDAKRPLQETGEVDTIFDPNKSELSDSCGRLINQTITSITEKIRADYIVFMDPPYEESPEKILNKKSVVVNADRPLVYIIMTNSVPLLCSTGSFMS